MERRLKGIGNDRRRSRGKLRKHCKASGLRCKAACQRRLVQYYLGLDAASRAEKLKDTRRTGTFATVAPFVRTKTALESAPAAARSPDSGTPRAGSNRPAEEGESVGRGPETENKSVANVAHAKMQCFACKSKSRRRKRTVHWDEWRTKTFSRHRNPTTRLVTPVLNKRRLRSETQFSRSCRQQATPPETRPQTFNGSRRLDQRRGQT